MRTTVDTFTRREFDVAAPSPEAVVIEDIAHGLSRICRWNGHTDDFYSVAEHSVLLARWIRSQYPENRQWILQALLHDAAEAYVGDHTTPLKELVPELRKVTARVQHAICQKFGVPSSLPDIVHAGDLRIIEDEWSQAMGRGSQPSPVNREPLRVKLKLWDLYEAEYQFLALFKSLRRP